MDQRLIPIFFLVSIPKTLITAFFVTIILILAAWTINEHHKNKNILNNNELRQSLDYISTQIENQNIDEAKTALENLRNHLRKN